MKIQIGDELHEIKKCPNCGRTVLVENVPATGWLAVCGNRLVNIADCTSGGCRTEFDAIIRDWL